MSAAGDDLVLWLKGLAAVAPWASWNNRFLGGTRSGNVNNNPILEFVSGVFLPSSSGCSRELWDVAIARSLVPSVIPFTQQTPHLSGGFEG